MSWHFSRALAAAFSGASSSGGKPCAPSSATPMPVPSSRPGRTTDALIRSQFGTTCGRSPSATTRWSDSSGSFAASAISSSSQAASPARTSHAPAKAQDSTGPDPASGLSSPESFARFCRATSSWKTPQCSLLAGLDEFSATWPQWGTMRAGECWAQSMPVHLIAGSEFGSEPSWPTQNVQNGGRSLAHVTDWRGKTAYHNGKKVQVGLEAAVKAWPTPTASLGTKGGRVTPRKGSEGGTLIEAVSMRTTWPTPRANDGEKRGNFDLTNPRNGLAAAAKLWPTPQAQDSKQNGPRPKSAAVMLGQAVMFPDAIAERERETIPTPCSTDWKGSMKDGQRRGQLTDPAQGVIPAGGALNPNWVEWLMNWPVGWTDLTKEAKHETEYWKAIGSTNLPSYGLREMWFNREAGAPSQGPEHGEQHARERGDSVPDVPPLGAYANQAGDLCYLRDGISPEEIQEIKALRGLAVRQDSRCEICRVAVGVVNRVDRLRCIGNGQVPAVVRLAWNHLSPNEQPTDAADAA